MTPWRFLVQRRRRCGAFSFYVDRMTWVVTPRSRCVQRRRSPWSTPWSMSLRTVGLPWAATPRLDGSTARTAGIVWSTRDGLDRRLVCLCVQLRLAGWQTVRWSLAGLTWTEVVTVGGGGGGMWKRRRVAFYLHTHRGSCDTTQALQR